VSPATRDLEKTARKVADSDLTILICGESGSGKEVLARYIHHLSPRANEAFVKVNCAALPEELLESELFGYERGAFTGAVSQKLGKFEIAEGGTILLDEITEMSQHLQAKFLHVLQDKQFNHLGGNRDIRVDVRVLAASNRPLEREVEEGRFREDLYFRLKVIDLYMPPLRERREEIPLLIDYFVERFAKQYHKPAPVLSQQFLNLLLAYRWDGNVRELENMIKRIVILRDEDSVMREILSRSVPGNSVGSPSSAVPQIEPEGETLNLKQVARRAALAAERTLILATLDKTRWNRRKASKLLGVSYKTLITKIKDCGLREG
jgi:two-component system response regulator AtoC